MKMNGVERMQLNDKTAETGQNRTEMQRKEWKGRYANGQEGFRKFNNNRTPFRQVVTWLNYLRRELVSFDFNIL